MDYWELVGDSPAGGAEAEINKQSNPDVQLDKRHLQIRGENCSKVCFSNIRPSFHTLPESINRLDIFVIFSLLITVVKYIY